MKKIILTVALTVSIFGSAWAISYVAGPSMPVAHATCGGSC